MYRYRTFTKFPLLTKQKIDTKVGGSRFLDLQGGGAKNNDSVVTKVTRVPSSLTKAPNGYKSIEFKGYKFFLPRMFIKKKGKESEYVDTERKDSMLVQIKDPIPVDDLCRMPDTRRDIQEFTQNIAFSRIDPKVQYIIL